MQGLIKTLAGRVAVLDLLPLAVEETGTLDDLSLDRLLETVFADADATTGRTVDAAEWCLRGGFPELHSQPQADRTLWLSSYVQTYLEGSHSAAEPEPTRRSRSNGGSESLAR